MKIKQWLGKKIETSSGLTPEFQSFYGDIKRYLKKELQNDFNFIINRGHFYFSGFAQNKQTNKWAYFSSSDIRYFQDQWYNNLLVRTTENNKDYTGGTNNTINITTIKQALIDLTK